MSMRQSCEERGAVTISLRAVGQGEVDVSPILVAAHATCRYNPRRANGLAATFNSLQG